MWVLEVIDLAFGDLCKFWVFWILAFGYLCLSEFSDL
jgi:hypothetical protein